jgi:hypothetical protein
MSEVKHVPHSRVGPSSWRLVMRTIVLSLCVVAVLALFIATPSLSDAAGADVVIGHGERGIVEFSFTGVFTPSGVVKGWARVETPTLSLTGKIACGSVAGNRAILGGRSDTGVDFVLMVSDGPDGIIFGTGRPNCDTTGFGDPASLPLSTGNIRVIDN